MAKKFDDALPTLLCGIVAALLVSCAGNGGRTDSSMPNYLQLKTLSNRADMISDGDALIEVMLPVGATADDIAVDVNGTDVTSHFAVRANGRFIGHVDGLRVGANVVTARLKSQPHGARLTITNYSRGGNIFAGIPIQPWVCATKTRTPVNVAVPGTTLVATVTPKSNGLDTDPVDADCNAPTKFSYYYMPKAKEGTSCTFTIGGASSCLQSYDPASRPNDADIANVTNDRGDTVKALLRVELGTMDRGMYEIAAPFDPAQPWTPTEPQKGWNGKVYWNMGGAATGNRFQNVPAAGGPPLFVDRPLRAGFITVRAQLTNHVSNNNDMLATEAIMMIKEHIIDTYGEIRYVMAAGASGGSTMQTVPTSIMPGLLDGLTTSASFPDTVTIWTETRDCHSLNNYYQTAAGKTLTDEQQAAINGHPSANYCKDWVRTYRSQQNPKLGVNCGGLPTEIVYDPTLRPQGVRCSIHDVLAPVVGTVKDADGIVKTSLPYDNVGVQYGLAALQAGKIDVEEFVALNEGIGSYDLDSVWTGGATANPTVPAPRVRADERGLAALYQSGMIENAGNLAGVPILDLRLETGPNLHMPWRSFAQRARLNTANGGHSNHVMWASDVVMPKTFELAGSKDEFAVMDRWLSAIEADKSSASKAAKVLRNKPAEATDTCWLGIDTVPVKLSADATVNTLGPNSRLQEVTFGSESCPVKPYQSPRIVAGEPMSDDIMKCQLRPLNFASPGYAGKTFTASQQARMKAVFPQGVCDWSKPSVGKQAWVPTSFQAGPGGTALPPPPRSVPF